MKDDELLEGIWKADVKEKPLVPEEKEPKEEVKVEEEEDTLKTK